MANNMNFSHPMIAPSFLNKQLKKASMKAKLFFILLFIGMSFISVYAQDPNTPATKTVLKASKTDPQTPQVGSETNATSNSNRVEKLAGKVVEASKLVSMLSDLWYAIKGLFASKSAETKNSQPQTQQTPAQQLPKTTTTVQPQGTIEIILKN